MYVCVCGSFCSLRTVPHSLLRCGWWCSCSCCLGGIVVNLRCFLFIILNFSFPFLEGNQYKFIPFFVLFFVVLLMSDVCLSAFLLCCCCCCCCLCYFPLQKTNSLHTHTTTRNRCVSAYACLRAFVCVRAFHLFSFVLLFTVAQWNEEN